MADTPPPDDHENPTPREMREWLAQEVRDVIKGMELRIKDATDFVTAYAVGEIDAKELERRQRIYTNRWGDAIPGVFTSEGMSNEEILRKRDNEHKEDLRRSQEAKSRAGGRGFR
jgi:hypothetical protein